jgi:Tol biopolymer transport system component
MGRSVRRSLLLALFLLAAVVDRPAPWQLQMLTACDAGVSSRPCITDDGRKVYFLSTCDLVGDNSDQSAEIFSWEAGSLEQLTRNSYCQVFDLAPAPDGERLAFISNCPYRNRNPDQGAEVMIREPDGEVKVLTRSRGMFNRDLVWSGDGRYLFFTSATNALGENPDQSSEIFLADLEAAPIALRQLSHSLAPAGCEKPAPAPAAVVARCNDDLPGTALPEPQRGLPVVVEGRTPGGNRDRNYELFSFGLEGEVRQLTRTADCINGPPVIPANGQRIAFMSNCNFSNRQEPDDRHFLYILSGDQFRQVFPALPFEARDLRFSRDGNSIAFSAAIATKRLNPGQNQEIFLVRLNQVVIGATSPGELPPGLLNVADFPVGGAQTPTLSADGRGVAFATNANYRRRNDDGGFEIMLASPPAPADDDEDAVEVEAGDTTKPEPKEEEEEE